MEILLKLFVYLLPFRSYSKVEFQGILGHFTPKMSCESDVISKKPLLEPDCVSVRRAVRFGRVPRSQKKLKKVRMCECATAKPIAMVFGTL
jgi:hypothetical protein